MSTILLATLAAIGFSGASLLALLGGEVGVKGRSYAAAFAAGILLALAFVDLFPEGLKLAGEPAIAGFVGGFVLLLLPRYSHAPTRTTRPGNASIITRSGHLYWGWGSTTSPMVSFWASA